MFTSILEFTESFIISNASWTVFLGCILEQILVPIPASLIVLSTTFLVMQGASFSIESLLTLIVKIVIPGALGITIGSFFYYYLAYKLGKPFINRTSRFLGVSVEDVEKVEYQFKESRYDDIFMFLGRCVPIIPSIAINLFCGLIRYDLKKYILTTFFGSAVQILGWGMVAWLAGNLYQTLETNISFLGNIVLVIIVLIVVGFIIYRKKTLKDGERTMKD
ncbi:MAG: VTT domain-containing protein [Methanobacterium sp.]|nr:VTT domain-containing protein [Methanobacterium sp.]